MSTDLNSLNIEVVFTKLNSMCRSIKSVVGKIGGCIFCVDSYCDVMRV